MKPDIDVLVVIRLRRRRRLNRSIAPRLRIAATIHNRSLQRWLRAAEPLAWPDADLPRRLQSRVSSKNIGLRSTPLETAHSETP